MGATLRATWATRRLGRLVRVSAAAWSHFTSAKLRRGSAFGISDRPESTRSGHLVGLLNHMIRPQQQRLGDGDSERLRRLQVDPKLEFGWLLDRQIGGLCPAEDSINK